MGIVVKAPAVVKLLGEHAAIYGKLSVAVAVSLCAQASAKPVKTTKFSLKLSDLDESARFSSSALPIILEIRVKGKPGFLRLSECRSRKGYSSLCHNRSTIPGRVEPKVTGQSVKVKSNIPKQSGLASSASCYTAFTVALLKATEPSLLRADSRCCKGWRKGCAHKRRGRKDRRQHLLLRRLCELQPGAGREEGDV